MTVRKKVLKDLAKKTGRGRRGAANLLAERGGGGREPPGYDIPFDVALTRSSPPHGEPHVIRSFRFEVSCPEACVAWVPCYGLTPVVSCRRCSAGFQRDPTVLTHISSSLAAVETAWREYHPATVTLEPIARFSAALDVLRQEVSSGGDMEPLIHDLDALSADLRNMSSDERWNVPANSVRSALREGRGSLKTIGDFIRVAENTLRSLPKTVDLYPSTYGSASASPPGAGADDFSDALDAGMTTPALPTPWQLGRCSTESARSIHEVIWKWLAPTVRMDVSRRLRTSVGEFSVDAEFHCAGKPRLVVDSLENQMRKAVRDAEWRAEWADAFMLTEGGAAHIIRFGADMAVGRADDCAWLLAQWYPWLFSDRGLDAVGRLGSDAAKAQFDGTGHGYLAEVWSYTDERNPQRFCVSRRTVDDPQRAFWRALYARAARIEAGSLDELILKESVRFEAELAASQRTAIAEVSESQAVRSNFDDEISF